jgi:hypothetical protein
MQSRIPIFRRSRPLLGRHPVVLRRPSTVSIAMACKNAAGQTFGGTARGGDRGEPVRHSDQAMAATSPTATA